MTPRLQIRGATLGVTEQILSRAATFNPAAVIRSSRLRPEVSSNIVHTQPDEKFEVD